MVSAFEDQPRGKSEGWEADGDGEHGGGKGGRDFTRCWNDHGERFR